MSNIYYQGSMVKGQWSRVKHYGFTLIELLVVIAIIGTLSTIITVVFISAQKTARDQQRKSDLAKIQVALEVYYSRNNRYPNEDYVNACDSSMDGSGTTCAPTGTSWDLTGTGTAVSDLKDLIDEGILPSLPVDPKNKLENGNIFLYHIELDKAAQGTPACPGTGNTTCRYLLQTLLENGNLYTGGNGICIYSIIGGGGNPNSANFLATPPADCVGNITPTGWSGKPCCRQ